MTTPTLEQLRRFIREYDKAFIHHYEEGTFGKKARDKATEQASTLVFG